MAGREQTSAFLSNEGYLKQFDQVTLRNERLREGAVRLQDRVGIIQWVGNLHVT